MTNMRCAASPSSSTSSSSPASNTYLSNFHWAQGGRGPSLYDSQGTHAAQEQILPSTKSSSSLSSSLPLSLHLSLSLSLPHCLLMTTKWLKQHKCRDCLPWNHHILCHYWYALNSYDPFATMIGLADHHEFDDNIDLFSRNIWTFFFRKRHNVLEKWKVKVVLA